MDVCNRHCPIVCCRVRTCFLPWVDTEISEQIKLKHYYQNEAHNKNLQILWKMYKHFRNNVSTMLKAAKKRYHTDIIIENMTKSRMMWKFTKQLLPSKSKNVPHGIMIEGKLVTDKNK